MSAIRGIRRIPRRFDRAGAVVRLLGTFAWAPTLFLIANVPLAIAIHRTPELAVFHAIGVLLAGVVWASLGQRRADHVACVGAYIVGCEVLWRMAGSQIAWEFGKYALILVLGLWMVQRSRLGGPGLVTFYFALLLPSAALTVMGTDELEIARQMIAFNLTGPLAVMIAVWFFSQVEFSGEQRRNLYVALIGPAIGIAAITFVSTVMNPDIVFGTESNRQASGGFGPNQVSAVLGLGALVALIAAAEERPQWGFRPMMLTCVVIMAAQSAFTFSRSGLYYAGVAAVVGSLFLLRDSRSRLKALVGAVVLWTMGNYVVFPMIDGFTEGALGARFADTDLTNRQAIVEADVQIWREHLFIGVGPGLGNIHREAYFGEASSHTEYSRLLAEHGMFGLGALISLIALVVQVIRKPHTHRESAIMASLFAWSFLFMLSSGMRLAAPAFIIGVACIPSTTQPPTGRRIRPFRRGLVRPAQEWLERAEAMSRSQARRAAR